MYLYRTIRNLTAIAAGVAVLSLVVLGNAVPAAFVYIAYVAWLFVRDWYRNRARERSWARANTTRKPGQRVRTGKLY